MAITLQDFNPEQVAQDITTALYQRMLQSRLPEDEAQGNANIAFEFAKIACNLILEDPTIQLSEGAPPVQLEVAQARQVVELFVEGIYHAAMKCWEYGITGDIKSQFLQSLAQEVFLQTKQVVVSTVGQEHTPDLQFSQSQQVAWVNQTAETSLMYYINEHEKQYGPLMPPDETSALQPTFPETTPPEADLTTSLVQPPPMPPTPSPQETPAAVLPVVETPVLPTAPALPEPPGRREKYAAMALFLSALDGRRQEKFLAKLGNVETQWVRHYLDTQRIAQELNMATVEKELEALKAQFKPAHKQVDPSPTGRLADLASLVQTTAELEGLPRIMETVRHERPRVQALVRCLLPEKMQRGLPPDSPLKPLPPAIEEAFYRYMKKQLSH